jgi:hypothetical protein
MMMSLNEPDRQALGCIEDGLACSDPRLASMLNIFSRLAAGEEIPAGEKIRVRRGPPAAHRPRHAQRRPRRGTALPQPRRLYQRLGWQQAMLVLWAVISAALLAVALALNTQRPQACIQPMGMASFFPSLTARRSVPLNPSGPIRGHDRRRQPDRGRRAGPAAGPDPLTPPQSARSTFGVTDRRTAIFHLAGTFG